jgi:protein-tyrosine phosphatase
MLALSPTRCRAKASAMVIRVCFVCLGNICRSPTAEGIFAELVRQAELESAFEIDSAGTGGWHEGESPDPRTQQAAAKKGFQLGGRARQVQPLDFMRFDYLIAMDRKNHRDLLDMAPANAVAKLQLFRTYDTPPVEDDVPDPYFGGPAGFDLVVDMVHRCSLGLLEALRPYKPSSAP